VIGSTESSLNGQIDYIRMEAKEGRVNSIHILELLYERGIHSVYLEGGAITTSNFLKDKAVDVLQLHLSPLIFGSGKSAITLPEIDEVKNAIKFSAFQFKKVGDAMMFIGQLH
jgi:diaminohydroxyphosphoribosylaminopyrimidine deaminase/5-amino-6-(5-phosphoribosylamino)uracil reductase